MEETSRFFRREDIKGKNVYDLNGKYIGKITDIGFERDGTIGLIVERDNNKIEFFPFSSVQAIGDIALVKSGPAASPSGYLCRACGAPIRQGARFCTNCGAKLV